MAIEARNLAPLPGDVDFTVDASLPISGLTAWQGLFEHGRLRAGQSAIAHGAAGAVGSMVTRLACEAGAYVIGTGRAADRQRALDFGAQEFVDLDNEALGDVGKVDMVFDLIGGDIGSGPRAWFALEACWCPSSDRRTRGPPTAWRSTLSSSPIVLS
jgi:NADPH:quinone reductase-like Zn-dependent oxidoreductase